MDEENFSRFVSVPINDFLCPSSSVETGPEDCREEEKRETLPGNIINSEEDVQIRPGCVFFFFLLFIYLFFAATASISGCTDRK